MSADYCRATNRILSKRAERDLNTFPLAWCCNSWMLGNNFQPSFPSLHSPCSFILKQVKNLRQSDLCSNWGRSLRSQTSAYICTQSAGPAPLDTESCFFCFFFFFLLLPHYQCNGVCKAVQPAACGSTSVEGKKPQLFYSHCKDCSGSSLPKT